MRPHSSPQDNPSTGTNLGLGLSLASPAAATLAPAPAQIVNIEYSEILEADVRGFAAGAPRALSEGYLIRMLQSCLTFTLAVGITMVTSITLVFVPPEGDAFDLWSLAFCWLLVAAALCDVLGLLFFFLGLNAAIFICFPLYSDVRRDAIYNATTGAVLGGTGQLTALDSGGFGLEFFTMPGGDENATSDDAALPRLSSAYLKGLIFGGFVILCYTLLVMGLIQMHAVRRAGREQRVVAERARAAAEEEKATLLRRRADAARAAATLPRLAETPRKDAAGGGRAGGGRAGGGGVGGGGIGGGGVGGGGSPPPTRCGEPLSCGDEEERAMAALLRAASLPVRCLLSPLLEAGLRAPLLASLSDDVARMYLLKERYRRDMAES